MARVLFGFHVVYEIQNCIIRISGLDQTAKLQEQ